MFIIIFVLSITIIIIVVITHLAASDAIRGLQYSLYQSRSMKHQSRIQKIFVVLTYAQS